jgi:hypothetical protein
VLGLTGWTCGLGSLLAVVAGARALGEIDRSGGRVEGRALAAAGMALGGVGLAVFAGFVLYAAGLLQIR